MANRKTSQESFPMYAEQGGDASGMNMEEVPSREPGMQSGHDSINQQRDDHTSILEQDLSSSQSEEDSPLAYARRHGLCRDYLQDNLLNSTLIPFPPPGADGDLLDPPGLSSLESILASRRLELATIDKEKWDVDRETAKMLASVSMPISDLQPMDFIHMLPSLRSIKAELPLLGVDHEVEMLRLQKRNLLRISAEGTIPFDVNEDIDEGMTWSAARIRQKSEIDSGLSSEKLDVSAETAEYLRSLMEVPAGPMSWSVEGFCSRKIARHVNVSPPLMPVSASCAHECLDLEALDSPAMPTTQEPGLEARDAHAQHLRRTSASIPKPNTQPSTIADAGNGPKDVEDPIQRNAQPPAATSERDLELGMQTTSDQTMRVPVPQVEEHQITVPWHTASCHLAAPESLMHYISSIVPKKEAKWKGISKLERMLPWAPFPDERGKVRLDETLDDDSCEADIAELQDAAELQNAGKVTFDSFVGKMDGLRVLDCEEEEEDELTTLTAHTPENEDQRMNNDTSIDERPAQVPKLCETDEAASTMSDLRTLVRKRQLELELDETRHKKATLQHSADATSAMTNTSQHQPFNMLGSVSRFMQLNGVGSGGETTTPADRHHTPTLRQEAAPTAVMIAPPTSQALLPREHAAPLPLPVVSHVPGMVVPVIMSTAFLSQRHLVRLIEEKLSGSCNIVERETFHDRTTKAIQDMQIAEADITVSPAMGIIVTTLQKVKQKPLPGQSDHSGVPERLVAIASRYESLMVLVSEGANTSHTNSFTPAEPQAMDCRDCEAIAELSNLASMLDTDVRVMYITGGTAELSHWIAACISRHGIHTDNNKHRNMNLLLPDETMWERFLRTAGMNAFAAQVVLAGCKAESCESHDKQTSSLHIDGTGNGSSYMYHGLAAFLVMSSQERALRFGKPFGISRVLARVSRAIDGLFRL